LTHKRHALHRITSRFRHLSGPYFRARVVECSFTVVNAVANLGEAT